MAKRILTPRWFGVDKVKFAPPRKRSVAWDAAREKRRQRRAEMRQAGTLKQQARHEGFIVTTDAHGATALKWAGHREYRAAETTRQEAAKRSLDKVNASTRSDGSARKKPKKNSSDAGQATIGSRA